MNNPYEEIYQKVISLSKQLGYATFDYLPNDQQDYPFVFVGEQVSSDIYTKDRTLGQTNLLIHVYAEFDRRSDVVMMTEKLLHVISNCQTTDHFSYQVIKSSTNIVGESSDNLQLWDGILELEFQYY